jgi:flagellar assembly protein FliH
MPSSDLCPDGATIAPFAFEQLESQVVDAFTAPEDVLAAVQAEAERIREQARAIGEKEGFAAGRAEVRPEIDAALAAAAEAAREIRALEDEVLRAAERDVVDLALRLAEKILAGALDVQPERVLDVARNALRRLADRRQVTVLVNPQDLELLDESLPQIAAELGGIDQLDVQADRRVGRGGAIVQTTSGEIDATIETQLACARDVAAAALAGELDPEAADAAEDALAA